LNHHVDPETHFCCNFTTLQEEGRRMVQALVVFVGAFFVSMLLVRVFASNVYDFLIVKMTTKWYRVVLGRLSSGDRVLDIGIGTASALLDNELILTNKNIQVVGVDYDQKYVNFAKNKIKQKNLQDRIQVHCKSIFDVDLGTAIKQEKAYDAAYFSGSWTLMPSPVQALHIASSFVKPDGKVFVTQTFQRATTPLLSTLKPMLKHLTTIDFGELHYEVDLEEYIQNAEEPVNGISLVLEENSIVPGSIDNNYQAARLLVFKKVQK